LTENLQIDIESKLEEFSTLLEDIKELLILQTVLKQIEIRNWIDYVFGKSQRLKRVYCSVDGIYSAGEIAKTSGIVQKHVSTALTKLYNVGLLDKIRPYKRGFIYQRKPIHDSLGIVNYIETSLAKEPDIGESNEN